MVSSETYIENRTWHETVCNIITAIGTGYGFPGITKCELPEIRMSLPSFQFSSTISFKVSKYRLGKRPAFLIPLISRILGMALPVVACSIRWISARAMGINQRLTRMLPNRNRELGHINSFPEHPSVGIHSNLSLIKSNFGS